MILWERVEKLNTDKVGRLVLLASVVEDFVCLKLVSGNVLRIELVVDDSVYDLSFAHKTWTKNTYSKSLDCLICPTSFGFLCH